MQLSCWLVESASQNRTEIPLRWIRALCKGQDSCIVYALIVPELETASLPRTLVRPNQIKKIWSVTFENEAWVLHVLQQERFHHSVVDRIISYRYPMGLENCISGRTVSFHDAVAELSILVKIEQLLLRQVWSRWSLSTSLYDNFQAWRYEGAVEVGCRTWCRIWAGVGDVSVTEVSGVCPRIMETVCGNPS